MNTEPQKSEMPELHDKLQSGRLVIGLSSAIPGFIKKDPKHKAISFAPYYSRDRWIDLPIAIIQELPNEQPLDHLPLSFALKPGSKKEEVLINIIGALTNTAPMMAKGNGTSKSNGSSAVSNAESGMCRRCALGDGFCVDCYL